MKISVKLSIAEIIYDIQNKTYLSGRSREAADESNYVIAANMQASDDDENIYQLRRSVNSALKDIRAEISECFTGESVSNENELEEAIENLETCVLSMDMPSNYNASNLSSLADAMHRYLVCKGIADWFAITSKTDAATYVDGAKQAMEQIKRAVCQRVRPQRPQTEPLT